MSRRNGNGAVRIGRQLVVELDPARRRKLDELAAYNEVGPITAAERYLAKILDAAHAELAAFQVAYALVFLIPGIPPRRPKIKLVPGRPT